MTTNGNTGTSVRLLNALIMEEGDRDVRVRYDVRAGLAQIRTVGSDGHPTWWTWSLPRKLAIEAGQYGLPRTAEWLNRFASYTEEAARDFFAEHALILDDKD